MGYEVITSLSEGRGYDGMTSISLEEEIPVTITKQYSYNLITWERSDHNLITFNLRYSRKLHSLIYNKTYPIQCPTNHPSADRPMTF